MNQSVLADRPLLPGFIAGAIAVLVFHQGALALLHAAGITPAAPYAMTPVPPLGVPQVLSAAFWGGIWGIVLAAFVWRGRGDARDWIAAVVFGAVAPTLVAWFVVSPLKHRPVAGGGVASAMATGIIVNAAWGLGAAAGLWLLTRRARGAALEAR